MSTLTQFSQNFLPPDRKVPVVNEDGHADRPQGCFVVIEGIDGSGKTTMARSLAQALEERGQPVTLIEKLSVSFPDPFLDRQMGLLREIVWNYPKQHDVGLVGNAYWFHLLMAWFGGIWHTQVLPALEANRVVVTDGWIHKYIARFSLKNDFPLTAWPAAIPDNQGITFLLRVDPRTAFDRKQAVNPSEAGRPDGVKGSARSAFVGYQQSVQRALEVMAEEHNWIIVDANDRDVCSVQRELLAVLCAANVYRLPDREKLAL